jgi:AhpD family alkylhydroperoxidase
MARIEQLPFEAWDDDLKAMFGGAQPSEFARSTTGVMANAPHVVKAMGAYVGALKAGSTLPARLLELVRLRVAFHNQCRTCMAVRTPAALEDGLTQDLVCSLEKPEEAPDLSEAEKAALAYADLMATNHFAIDEKIFARLGEHFTPGQIIELGAYIGTVIGFGRFYAGLQMVDALPEGYRETGVLAPWKLEPAGV